MTKAQRHIAIYITTSICLIISVVILSIRSAPNPHIYIALGDSVSSGYGLSGYIGAPEGRHTTLFFDKLHDAELADEYYNFATSGYTTSDLLNMLNNKTRAERRLFNEASVITINVGGNNLLTPFLAYLSDLQVVSGAGNIQTGAGRVLSGAWGIMYEIASGVGSVISPYEDASFSFGGVVRGVGDIFAGFGGVLLGAGELVFGSPELVDIWRGALSPELAAIFDESLIVFHEDFTEIISWLNTNAPYATIIVNTVFNPIPQEILIISVPISNWASVLIHEINSIIVSESADNGLFVTDIHQHFTDNLELMQFNLNPLSGPLSFDIVHPNEEGHELIAQLHYATITR